MFKMITVLFYGLGGVIINDVLLAYLISLILYWYTGYIEKCKNFFESYDLF